MPNIFDSVKMTRPGNNVFDLSHDVKMSMNMGELIPIMLEECVPGDKFNISAESLIRFAPLVSPVMHRMDATIHYFFVPNRLVWPSWEDYITNTKEAGNLPAFPTLNLTQDLMSAQNRLADYLGIPTPLGGSIVEKVSAIPFAAYQKVYNEYYRDQNLITEVDTELADGDNTADYATKLGVLRRRAWEHDYFTSALPWAQKGDSVDIPLGTVQLDPSTEGANTSGMIRPGFDYSVGQTGALYGADAAASPFPDGTFSADPNDTGDGTVETVYDPMGTLQVEPTTINTLRRAFKLQEWLEKMARGGSRYIEVILSHFGVKSSDKRLQRPEYITGSKTPVVISEVVNTTGTVDAPQGNLAGHGIAVVDSKSGSYYCEEHGYIIGIMSVMPKTAYQQGLARHWIKTEDPTDFYWPSFANIGEQEIKNREVYAFQAGSAGENTFGYIPRYAEYKFANNRVAGDFRNSLDFWHLGRIFTSAPALNQQFIECSPTHRVFAVTDPTEEKLYCHVYNKVRAVRPMPKYGTPTF